MSRFINTLLVILVASLMAGCAATVEETEKWAPRERAEIHVRLGLDYLKRNQYDIARSEFDLAISIDSKSDSAYHAKGLLLAQSGYPDQATPFFEKAVKLNRSNFTATNDYGIHLCQQGLSDQGLKQLNRIEKDPANDKILGTYLGLGICYEKLKQDEDAGGYFRYVLDQQPRLPQALLPMAEISYRNGQSLSARGFIERYFSNGSISAKSLLLAVRIELKLNNRDQAERYGRELTRRFPGSPQTEQLSLVMN